MHRLPASMTPLKTHLGRQASDDNITELTDCPSDLLRQLQISLSIDLRHFSTFMTANDLSRLDAELLADLGGGSVTQAIGCPLFDL